MTPERWQQVKQIFQSAIERSPAERSAFVAHACAGDPALRSEVESLISSHNQAGDSIQAMAAEAATEMLSDDQAGRVIGKRIGRYEVMNLIGRGGMGEVFLAQDASLGRKVALKLLRGDLTKDEERLRRFQQEARAASALNHPNIITIHEIDKSDSAHFIATEFIEGETLRERLRASVEIDDALDIAIQAASALAAAHKVNIVHRDIKPENIMIRSEDGLVKVLDFGLARTTQPKRGDVDTQVETSPLIKTGEGVVLGTVAYMSPEQARGQQVDERTDIWSLGVVLYEVVTQCQPFAAGTSNEIISAILSEDPPPLARFAHQVPERLAEIVDKALAKNRDERYQSVKDLLIDLQRLKQSRQVQAAIERSASPDKSETTSDRLKSVEKGPTTTHAVSSVEYIVEQVKLHKRGAMVGLGLLVLASSVGLFIYYRHARAAPILTDKDTIVLADFANTTGDDAFDGTLKQALATQLDQSPFLNIVSDRRVSEALRLMNKPADQKVTRDIAAEICQRQGLKAYIAGSIASLGSQYLITIEAVNGQTGDVLVREEAEAGRKEQVLAALGDAVTKLRGRLGESLASIQKYNVPMFEPTTSSLEAFKAYSAALELMRKGSAMEAITYLKRAVELDPDFAAAYGALFTAYWQTGQRALSIEAAEKAMSLRDRISEHEKLLLAAGYYQLITGEEEKAIDSYELLTHIYPSDVIGWNNLGGVYMKVGRYDKAVEKYQAALRLEPISYEYSGLAISFMALDRYEEARAICEQAVTQGFDSSDTHFFQYAIGVIKDDERAMQAQIDWVAREPNSPGRFIWPGYRAIFLGQVRKGRELFDQGIEIEELRNKWYAANDAATIGLSSAMLGDCRRVKEDADHSLAIGPQAKLPAALALALCGEGARAKSLTDEVVREYPKDTLINSGGVPVVLAAIEIRRNNAARAIELLQPARAYFGGWVFKSDLRLLPEYMSGQSYLSQKAGGQAASEFKTIIDHRGMSLLTVIYPLARLGLARAAVLQGDTTKARKAYEDFFALWKDADADLPVLIEAKKEYEKLR